MLETGTMLTHSSSVHKSVVVRLLLHGYQGTPSTHSSFRAKMKILAYKISEIISHFAKHPIYVTVSFKEECYSR